MCNKEDGDYSMDTFEDTSDSWDDGPEPHVELETEDPHDGYCDFCGCSECFCVAEWYDVPCECPRCENFKCTCEVESFVEELERVLCRTRDPKKAQRRIHTNRLSRYLA